jgi:phosphoenolpyruvate carboxykinase (ATP)
MNDYGMKAENASLESIGLKHTGNVFWNMSPSELVEEIVIQGQGVLTDTGAIAIETGEFTGRSPLDKFCVFDEKTENSVWWGQSQYQI